MNVNGMDSDGGCMGLEMAFQGTSSRSRTLVAVSFDRNLVMMVSHHVSMRLCGNNSLLSIGSIHHPEESSSQLPSSIILVGPPIYRLVLDQLESSLATTEFTHINPPSPTDPTLETLSPLPGI